MNELYNLSIKELIESIDENISETNETRKKLVIEINQEEDAIRKSIRIKRKEKCDKDMFRFETQKLEIKEMMKEHAIYAYKKTAQECQVQEQQLIKYEINTTL